jgi:large subunit ribosomal protein L18
VKDKYRQRERRKKRVRKKIFGTKDRPRLSIHKSNRYLYLQLIDDEEGKTLLFLSSLGNDYKKGNCAKNLKVARKIGKDLAEQAKKKKIEQLVLDRGPYRYHGRIRDLAEAIRKQGIKI